MKQRFQHFREFVQYDLWRHPHVKTQDPKKRLWYRVLQTVILVARGFKNQALVVRANSLSFALLFAFIPMLAMIYAIARGFGFEEMVSEQLAGSFLAEANVAPVLLEWVERYLETARGGLFVGIGLVVLIWAVYAFFNMLENSFNSIWNVKKTRSFARRMTNYVMTLLLVPILVVVTSGISIFLNSTEILASVLSAIEPLRKFMLRFIPFVATSAVFTWIFMAIPSTQVKFSSAIIPGVLMGFLYQVVQALSMFLVVLFTRMSIVYGAFSAIPLVLIWLHITCWLLLIGAELAFAIQNNELFAYERDLETISRRYRDYVMLYLLSVIIRRFEQGEQRLEETNIVRRVLSEQEEDPAFVPAMDIHQITVEKVLGRVAAHGTEAFLQHTPPEMQAFWQRYLQMCEANTSDNILVGDL